MRVSTGMLLKRADRANVLPCGALESDLTPPKLITFFFR